MEIQKNGKERKPSEFDFVMEETEQKFCTVLSNGKEVELGTGGKAKPVTHDNYQDFISQLLKVRLNET